MEWSDMLRFVVAVLFGSAVALVALFAVGKGIAAVYVLCFELITGKDWHMRDRQ